MGKEQFNPPPGPPPGYSKRQEPNSYGQPSQNFAPPPGPPPGYGSDSKYHGSGMNDFRPPPGPPPSAAMNDFQPPPGPPPSASMSDFQPPPGPPPHTGDAQPPEYAPWLAVPDTSLLPPAPAMFNQVSATANATKYSADQAKMWCQENRLYPPGQLSHTDHENLRVHGYVLGSPPINFAGDLTRRQVNTWSVRTRKKCEDCVLMTTYPMYLASEHDPLRNRGQPYTIYYEIRVTRMGSEDSAEEADGGIAIGFAAPPYPPFRLPGWERASLGVHGDDGCRYIDDDGGGQDFTTYFKNGETVGIGMTFKPAQFPGRRRDVDVFFTREGQREGGWSMYEERDQTDAGSIFGLEGDHDLMAAIGMFGPVEFEVRFRREEWLYRP